MHELAICQALLNQVKAYAQQHQAESVESISIQWGPLSGVEVSLLRRAFSLAKGGTIARNADLKVQQLPIRVRCKICNHQSLVPPNRLVCEYCGDWQTRLIQGDELLLSQIVLSGDKQPLSISI